MLDSSRCSLESACRPSESSRRIRLKSGAAANVSQTNSRYTPTPATKNGRRDGSLRTSSPPGPLDQEEADVQDEGRSTAEPAEEQHRAEQPGVERVPGLERLDQAARGPSRSSGRGGGPRGRPRAPRSSCPRGAARVPGSRGRTSSRGRAGARLRRPAGLRATTQLPQGEAPDREERLVLGGDGKARVRRVDSLLPLPKAEVRASEHLVATRLVGVQADGLLRRHDRVLVARRASITRARA